MPVATTTAGPDAVGAVRTIRSQGVLHERVCCTAGVNGVVELTLGTVATDTDSAALRRASPLTADRAVPQRGKETRRIADDMSVTGHTKMSVPSSKVPAHERFVCASAQSHGVFDSR